MHGTYEQAFAFAVVVTDWQGVCMSLLPDFIYLFTSLSQAQAPSTLTLSTVAMQFGGVVSRLLANGPRCVLSSITSGSGPVHTSRNGSVIFQAYHEIWMDSYR